MHSPTTDQENSSDPQSWERTFLASAHKRLLEYKILGDKTLRQLTAEEMHVVPAPGCNSIAVIIRHLHGNMLSRWTNFLTEDGEKPWRQRDEEFSVAPVGKEVLLDLWHKGWNCLLQTLESLQPADLQKTIYIRSEPLLVTDAIIRQVAHYSGHIGQVIYLGKMLKGASWQSLSIPAGASEKFNQQMQDQFNPALKGK